MIRGTLATAVLAAAVLVEIVACGGTVATEPLHCSNLSADACGARDGCLSTSQFVDAKRRPVQGCYPECTRGKRACGGAEKCEALIWAPKGSDAPDVLVEVSICRQPQP
jgi:hypothetical protein